MQRHNDWRRLRQAARGGDAARNGGQPTERVQKFGTYENWQGTPECEGGGNYMITFYSFAFPFPGAVLSMKSGGYYDPSQFER